MNTAPWYRLWRYANENYGGDFDAARRGAVYDRVNFSRPVVERDSFGLAGIYDPKTDTVIDNSWDAFNGTSQSVVPEPSWSDSFYSMMQRVAPILYMMSSPWTQGAADYFTGLQNPLRRW